MSKTYKDSQGSKREDREHHHKESEHDDYVAHKKEKRLINALRNADLDILNDEELMDL